LGGVETAGKKRGFPPPESKGGGGKGIKLVPKRTTWPKARDRLAA